VITGHNTPGLPPLNPEERTYVDAALEAMQSLKKTFEFWMAIAQGLKALRDKADYLGGRYTFDRLRVREGLGAEVINKTRVSRLLSILARREEVERWRATLSSNQRFEWASPEAVWNHCHIFHAPRDGEVKAKPSAMAELKRVNVELQEENYRLRKRDAGSLFDLRHDSADDIATAIVGNMSIHKAQNLAKAIIALLKSQKQPAG
jgi:hypothetical protein